MHAGSLYGVKALFADLKLGVALEDVKGLVCLDVVVSARLKAWLAVLFDDFKSLIGIVAGDLDDHLVSLRIYIPAARWGVFAFSCHAPEISSFSGAAFALCGRITQLFGSLLLQEVVKVPALHLLENRAEIFFRQRLVDIPCATSGGEFDGTHHSVLNVSSIILRKPNCSAMAICGGSKLAASTSPSSNARRRAPKPPVFTVLMFSSGRYFSSRYGTLKWLPARMPTEIGTSFKSSGLWIFESGRTKIAHGDSA